MQQTANSIGNKEDEFFKDSMVSKMHDLECAVEAREEAHGKWKDLSRAWLQGAHVGDELHQVSIYLSELDETIRRLS